VVVQALAHPRAPIGREPRASALARRLQSPASMILRFSLIAAAACACACTSTVFRGVAPAPDHNVYVLGAKDSDAQAWLCRDVAGGAKPVSTAGCREVDVVIEGSR
jgi:hypothetical protein